MKMTKVVGLGGRWVNLGSGLGGGWVERGGFGWWVSRRWWVWVVGDEEGDDEGGGWSEDGVGVGGGLVVWSWWRWW